MSIRIVILCGGSGTRLWPESRQNLPKQFIPIFKGKSLFELTLERIKEINNQKNPIVITNKAHGFLVKESLQKYKIKATIILEPESKNTAGAIYMAAKTSCENDTLIIMPSDHLIPNTDEFKKSFDYLIDNKCNKNWITFGIKPTSPSEAYGYIKIDNKQNNKLFNVIEFVEKPNLDKAKMMLLEDNYLWNSGIFAGNSLMILKSIRKHANQIAKVCDLVFDHKIVSNEKNEINFDKKQFTKIPSNSIDFAVMEKEKNIKLFPLKCEWNDLGSWDAISKIKNFDLKTNNIIEIESKNNFIRSNKKLIATIGINNLIIIDNDDAILIAKKGKTEKVKLIVAELNKKNMKEGIESTYEIRPWGNFKILLDSKVSKVKKLNISPRKRLSLQYHNFRSEHWVVIKGTATIFIDGKILKLISGMSIDIPMKSQHYIHNNSDDELIIIETQLGEYFGEDDIIRLDDPYKR